MRLTTVQDVEGMLRGKCLPGDLRCGESLAQYIARKINAAELADNHDPKLWRERLQAAYCRTSDAQQCFASQVGELFTPGRVFFAPITPGCSSRRLIVVDVSPDGAINYTSATGALRKFKPGALYQMLLADVIRFEEVS